MAHEMTSTAMVKEAIVMAMILVLLAATTSSAGPLDTTVVLAKCTGETIPQGSPFLGHLGTTLIQLSENTAYVDGFHFKVQNGGGNCPAFGEASCDLSLSVDDCCHCVSTLANDIWRICNNAIGAEVHYSSCSIRYEQFRF